MRASEKALKRKVDKEKRELWMAVWFLVVVQVVFFVSVLNWG
mgnify:CR=1 FL=1